MVINEIADTILRERVVWQNEGPDDMVRRVVCAVAVSDSEELKKEYHAVVDGLYFLPNSPCLMNAGTDIGQLCACFVLPIEDSIESIFETLKNAALVQKSGGGTGFSFTRLRPEGDEVSSTGGIASGPVSFLKVFNAAVNEVEQGGRRRGASLAVLNVDHPDILQFIRCKRNTSEITNFNISVGVTDTFMDAVKKGEKYDLINPRNSEVVESVSARTVWNEIVKNAWETGEPGILFLDRINADNPTPEVGRIESCNPCGETNLLPCEPCVLGSINLSKFAGGDGRIDYERLGSVTEVAVRFLDSVIDVSTYPIPEIEEMAKANRKIGLGVMGWADMLYKLNIPYDSEDALRLSKEVMSFINSKAVTASEMLAREKGAFPNFGNSVFKDGPPRRNAAVTSIAPTGTIADIAGTTYSIEPEYALVHTRRILDGKEFKIINRVFKQELERRGIYSDELISKIESNRGSVQGIDEIPEDMQRVFRVAHDIAPSDHVKMQAAFQEYTEQSISKTINLPSWATPEQVGDTLMLAWVTECKGVTVYRDGARPEQVLSTKHKPLERPGVLSGETHKFDTGCGSLYVTVNRDSAGGVHEVFATHNKNNSGGCVAVLLDALAKLASKALRAGVEPGEVIDTMAGHVCGHCQGGVKSCPDAISMALKGIMKGACSRGGVCEFCG